MVNKPFMIFSHFRTGFCFPSQTSRKTTQPPFWGCGRSQRNVPHVYHIYFLKLNIDTPLKFKMEPEKKSLEKEIPVGKPSFSGSMLKFGGGRVLIWPSLTRDWIFHTIVFGYLHQVSGVPFPRFLCYWLLLFPTYNHTTFYLYVCSCIFKCINEFMYTILHFIFSTHDLFTSNTLDNIGVPMISHSQV